MCHLHHFCNLSLTLEPFADIADIVIMLWIIFHLFSLTSAASFASVSVAWQLNLSLVSVSSGNFNDN